MSRKVFISYKFEEKGWKNDALLFFQAQKGKAQATPVCIEDGDIQGPNRARIKDTIAEKLAGCDGLLVIIGNNAQSSEWVAHEVGKAIELEKEIAYTRYKNASGGVPQIIDDHKAEIPKLGWSHDEIAAWVNAL
jgi:antiphage defense system Thoeris ThsB-like protein